MKIEIKNTNTKKASKLISKFLEMNENSVYDYLENDNIFVGYNSNSGFSYIYLENNPHISLCLNDYNELCIVYSSYNDGLEFINYDIPSNIDKLESILNKAYDIENDIREDDYKDADKTDLFIETMEQKGWALI